MVGTHTLGPRLRRIAVAGLLAVSALGAIAGGEQAQAFPLAAPRAGLDASAVTEAQYVRPYRYRRFRYGYRRRAGLYTCGPRALHTRLQRRAC